MTPNDVRFEAAAEDADLISIWGPLIILTLTQDGDDDAELDVKLPKYGQTFVSVIEIAEYEYLRVVWAYDKGDAIVIRVDSATGDEPPVETPPGLLNP